MTGAFKRTTTALREFQDAYRDAVDNLVDATENLMEFAKLSAELVERASVGVEPDKMTIDAQFFVEWAEKLREVLLDDGAQDDEDEDTYGEYATDVTNRVLPRGVIEQALAEARECAVPDIEGQDQSEAPEPELRGSMRTYIKPPNPALDKAIRQSFGRRKGPFRRGMST